MNEQEEIASERKILVHYTYSPRDWRCYAYATGNVQHDYVHDNDLFRGEDAEKIIAAIEDGRIWTSVDLNDWEVLDQDNEEEINQRGTGTLVIAAADLNDDGEEIARTSRVICIPSELPPDRRKN